MKKELEDYFDRLFPLLRSLTGDGVKKTHDILSEIIPLQRIEVPSGTQCFDWTVPKEWVVKEAYIIDPNGKRRLDVKTHNLHLLNYSIPFKGTLSKEELEKHLYSLPKQPQAIPYVTSYYEPRWGFCLSQEERDQLPKGDYQVVIDTDLIDGSMTISEAVLPGKEPQEILFSTYTCHPSLANNELSGPLVTAFLYQMLASLPERRFTYRFVFLPETIGSIAYLNRMGDYFKKNLIAGFVVTCCGDSAPFTYKKSRIGNSLTDRIALKALQNRPHSALDFFPSGSDERQYCSPGFNLPVGSLMRSMYGTYPEYHTSLDNKDFISFSAMEETIKLYFELCQMLEMNRTYINLNPNCEPKLSKRGLYPTLGNQEHEKIIPAMMWVLNYSDGKHDLLAISEKSGIDLQILHLAALKLLKEQLILDPICP